MKLFQFHRNTLDHDELKILSLNGRFFTLIFVIFIHIALYSTTPGEHSLLIDVLNYLVFFFAMPLFCFFAGFFCKNDLSKFRAQQLLINIVLPYFMYNLILAFIVHKPVPNFLFEPAFASWFLLCMLYWNYLIIFFENIKYNILLSVIIGILVACAPDVDGLASLTRCFFYFPFFLLGYVFSQKKIFITIPKLLAIVIFIAIYFILLYGITDVDRLGLLLGKTSNAALKISNLEGSIYRLLSYILSFLAMLGFLAFIPKTKNIFTSLGENSLYGYLGHPLFVFALTKLGVFHNPLTVGQDILLLITAFTINIIVCSNPFKVVASHVLQPRFLIKLFIKTDEFKAFNKSNS